MKHRPSFTLFEVLVSISIIGIIMLASFPVVVGFIAGLELGGSAGTIVSDLRYAQQKAITLVTTVRAEFRPRSLLGDPARYFIKRYDPAKKAYLVIKTVKLPLKYDFREGIILEFARTGFPTVGGSGTVVVEDVGGRIKRVIVSSAGRIRAE